MVERWLQHAAAGVASTVLFLAGTAHAQPGLAYQRDQGRAMLAVVRDDIRRYYYDPALRGLDIDGIFKAAEATIGQAQSSGQVFGTIAQAVLSLGDSHIFFIPPARANRVVYGYQLLAVGEKVFVTAVKPGSDASSTLAVGDQVVAVNGVPLGRADVERLLYILYQLRPQLRVRMTLRRAGQDRDVDVTATLKGGAILRDFTGDDVWWAIRAAQDERRLDHHRYLEVGDDLLVWKMPSFVAGDDDSIAAMTGKARRRAGLILDLRGNPGGSATSLEWLAGHLFDRELTIADLRGRKETKTLSARRRGVKDFPGKLVVLVDSGSASAAEVFARLVQIEKRGTVIGDRTAGAVMLSRVCSHELGYDTVVPYGVSVTQADVIMSDGKSLEGSGVAPDEVVLPSAEDLAVGRDPALARAAALLGAAITPEEAGRFFPVEWSNY